MKYLFVKKIKLALILTAYSASPDFSRVVDVLYLSSEDTMLLLKLILFT